ncbi:M48 family metallopeptidase [Candidatus Woesebacteria bacterium]|nr:M48 family metallopeptidase [Candidatus Woesebacteria bacterium]
MKNIYEVQQSNKVKSALVIVGFLLFVTLTVYVLAQAFAFYLGYSPGGLGFFGLALIVSGISTLVSYYFSDSIVLGISGARPASRKTDFEFYTVAQNISIGTGLPMPKLYVIADSAPNAFATGRDPAHSVVCATEGLLEKLNRTELEGVVAHEMSHIRNYDTRLMSLVTVMVGLVALLGDWFLRMSWFGGRSRDKEEGNLGAVFMFLGIIFALLSPIVSQIVQLAISRRREFMADSGSVEITRQPEGLILALQKISKDIEPLEAANKATAHLYIVNPFKEGRRGAVTWFSHLFDTHPPVEERIKALKAMI